MNRSSAGARGFKLTTVILAVLVLAVSALFSNASVAADMERISYSQSK